MVKNLPAASDPTGSPRRTAVGARGPFPTVVVTGLGWAAHSTAAGLLTLEFDGRVTESHGLAATPTYPPPPHADPYCPTWCSLGTPPSLVGFMKRDRGGTFPNGTL